MARHEDYTTAVLKTENLRSNLWHLIVCYKKAKNLINDIETICRPHTFNFLRQLFYFTKNVGPNYTVSVWNYVIDA